ncbi:hypothetical protein TNCV_695331 [Trichonephila clavipes]|nr:hypothetical protein TNCV_695331 [Trichonephila clavipes]
MAVLINKLTRLLKTVHRALKLPRNTIPLQVEEETCAKFEISRGILVNFVRSALTLVIVLVGRQRGMCEINGIQDHVLVTFNAESRVGFVVLLEIRRLDDLIYVLSKLKSLQVGTLWKFVELDSSSGVAFDT